MVDGLDLPSGLVIPDAAGSQLFVAEQGTGDIHEYDLLTVSARLSGQLPWSSGHCRHSCAQGQYVQSFPSGATTLQGLAADFSIYPGSLFYTDSYQNKVMRLTFTARQR